MSLRRVSWSTAMRDVRAERRVTSHATSLVNADGTFDRGAIMHEAVARARRSRRAVTVVSLSWQAAMRIALRQVWQRAKLARAASFILQPLAA